MTSVIDLASAAQARAADPAYNIFVEANAGSGKTRVLVDRVEGDVANVIGLPVGLLYRLAPELEA